MVAMGTKCIVSNLHWKYELNMTKDKEVLWRFHFDCHDK